MAEKYINVANQETSEEINGKLGLANDTGGSESAGTVMGKLNSILNGAVKSVQSGHAVSSSGGVTVTISPVNINKAIVIVHGAGMAGLGEGISYFYYGNLKSSTTLEVMGGNSNDGVKRQTNVYWQVAEFY